MNKRLLAVLACPVCKGRLEYRRRRREMWCRHDRLAFPVRNSIPVLLEMDARPLDEKPRAD